MSAIMKAQGAVVEAVRELADANAVDLDDELDFYAAALELGMSESDAEAIDHVLCVRVMRARGAI